MEIGSVIMKKRKELGYTQQNLADRLHVSFQAVSKWENGTACPEIDLLPGLAAALGVSIDTLLGYRSAVTADYEGRYQKAGYYWGLKPNQMCYSILKLRLPVKPQRVLDIGCGEGRQLAEHCGVQVNFFKADLLDYRMTDFYDIFLCSGVLHFVRPEIREELLEHLKAHTTEGGIHAINVFVGKPFVKAKTEYRFPWKSGELFCHYSDWYFHEMKEAVFDCTSGGIPHQHCMDTMIAEKYPAIAV